MMTREEMDTKMVKFETSYSDFAMLDALVTLGVATLNMDVERTVQVTMSINDMNKSTNGPFVKNIVNMLRMRLEEVAPQVFATESSKRPEVAPPFFGLGNQAPKMPS